MSKFTTTINEIINGELLKRGENEFINNGRLTFNDPKYAFIQKIIRYDDDVSSICNDIIFKGFSLKDKSSDKKLKKSFVNRFLDREINRQTVEAFASQVVYLLITHEDYLNVVFSDRIDNYLNNHNVTTTTQLTDLISHLLQDDNRVSNDYTHNENTVDNRQAETTLPQDKVNVNVDNTLLDYADNNAIEKTKDNTYNYQTNNTFSDSNTQQNQNTSQNTDTLVKNYDVENVKKIYDLRERIFNHFDKNCFLQIW